jgi:formylglycine-generating enzyme required for sulfatase activity
MGANCDQCVDARFIGPNCDVCADFRFTGAMCDQCANPLHTGENCDECIDTRFEGANCDKANASYQSSLGLQWVQSVVNNIYFARTETTVRQFQACVMTGACSRGNYRIQLEPGSSSCSYDRAGSSEHPMSCVNWFGAVEFCTWIGARLPSRSEWIQEASNNGDRRYPWGDTPRPSCTHLIMHQGVINNMPGVGCGVNSTWPVCSKPEGNSVSGLCDLGGNVQEWTTTVENGRTVYCNSNYKDGYVGNFRADAYERDDADDTSAGMGFRCVRQTLP